MFFLKKLWNYSFIPILSSSIGLLPIHTNAATIPDRLAPVTEMSQSSPERPLTTQNSHTSEEIPASTATQEPSMLSTEEPSTEELSTEELETDLLQTTTEFPFTEISETVDFLNTTKLAPSENSTTNSLPSTKEASHKKNAKAVNSNQEAQPLKSGLHFVLLIKMNINTSPTLKMTQLIKKACQRTTYISTPKDLLKIRKNSSSESTCFILMNDINLSPEHYTGSDSRTLQSYSRV